MAFWWRLSFDPVGRYFAFHYWISSIGITLSFQVINSAVPLQRGQFSANSSQNTPHSSPVRLKYGCLLWIRILIMFCKDISNIMLYWTALKRHSTVFVTIRYSWTISGACLIDFADFSWLYIYYMYLLCLLFMLINLYRSIVKSGFRLFLIICKYILCSH